jgi:putative salt-induced outer membrane protein YdiY
MKTFIPSLTVFLFLGMLTSDVAGASATNKWLTTASAGLTLTRGNSETLLGNARIDSTRKWPRDEVLLGASTTYGESTIEVEELNAAGDPVKRDETSTTANNITAFGQYNHSFTERWYGGFRLDYLHDEIADVKYRVTISPLVGYYAIKQPKTTLKFEAGPSAVIEKQGDDTDEYAALRFGERFEHKFTDKSRVWQSVDFMPQVDRFHNYIITAEIGAEAALTPRLSLRGQLLDTYDNVPADDRKKNDIKLITSLAYTF